MKDEDRKRLTGFLRECWHDPIWTDHRGQICETCNIDNPPANRTFTTEADTVALYRRLHEVGKWEEVEHRMTDLWYRSGREDWFIAWLFCLSGEGYEERCRMVNDFLEVKPEQEEKKP